MDSRIKEILDSSKIIVFDIDGVLSQPFYQLNGRMVQGTSLLDDDACLSWIKYCIRNEDSYKYCTAPLVMQNLVNSYGKEKDLYALTTEHSSFALYDKIKFLNKYYGDSFEGRIHFVDKDCYKVPVLLEIADYLGIEQSEIAFVEDTFKTCIEACDKGISAIHISHFMTEGVVLTDEYKQSHSNKNK